MSVNELIIGNLNCVLVGKVKFDLLDRWDEYTRKAFESGASYGRKPGFLILNGSVTHLGSNEPVVLGRFVKNTQLEIKQVLRGDNLLERNERHESAPSAIFVYLLRTHVVLYMGEFPGYPDVRAFRRFLENVINRERKQFLQEHRTGLGDSQIAVLMDENPRAHVSFIPLSSNEAIAQQFSHITRIRRIRILQYLQNGNLNTESFIHDNAELMEAIGAKKMETSVRSPGNMDGAISLVKEIGKRSDADFELEADTESGKRKITKDGVKYRKDIRKVPERASPRRKANLMLKEYLSAMSAGEVPQSPQRNKEQRLNSLNYERTKDQDT